MQKQAKVGLLALYLKLYDDTQSWLRPDVEEFKSVIEHKLEENIQVVKHDICRVKAEVEEAVRKFEDQDVDAIVTLHLAYSPSLECYEVLGTTKLPIIVLDTTPDYSFDAVTGAGRIMQNHGIHGVQDMCSMLRRTEIPYQIFAGHHQHSSVLDKVIKAARGAMMAKKMKNSRVGRVGDSFEGMGDFYIGDSGLAKMDIEIVPFDFEEGAKRLNTITDEAILAEWEADQASYKVENLSDEAYAKTARVGLAMREWIEEEQLDALTVNFLATDNNPALPVMPFLEMCKSMQRGIGYAGEGDVMNAAFVAALMQGFTETTFAEMFCPNWENNSVFCSHMGEFNPVIAAEPILMTELDFSYTSADNPAVIYACMKENRQAGFVNLNPIENGRFVFIAAPGKMLPIEKQASEMNQMVRGWFAPDVPLITFLEKYSQLGGGHHGAIIYNMELDVLQSFAFCMGWDFVVIE